MSKKPDNLECRKCGSPLAKIAPNGTLILGGMYVRMVVILCSNCNTLTYYPDFVPVLNLDQSDLDQMVHALVEINAYGQGWGKLIIEYRDGKVWGVGMEVTNVTHARKTNMSVIELK